MQGVHDLTSTCSNIRAKLLAGKVHAKAMERHSRETFSIIYYLCRSVGGGGRFHSWPYVSCLVPLTNLQPDPDEL